MRNNSPPCERGEGRKAAGGFRAAVLSGPLVATAPTIPTLIRPLRGHLPYPFCPFGTFPLDKGNRPPGRGKA